MSAARRDAVAGLALCVAYCAAAVAVRGAQWDETLEHAQVISGVVAYPAGHPLPHYLARAFSLQTLASSAMLFAGLGDGAVCAARNFLFLLATVLPVYAAALALTRRPALGVAAALFVAQGVFLEFDGNYPIMVWPGLYSNGHIGTGWAVLCVAALAAPWPRAGMLLLGLLPGVHAGQAPLVFALAAVLCAAPDGAALRGAWRWLAAGLAVSLLGAWIHRGIAPPSALPAEDAIAWWRVYTFGHDPHRQIPRAAAWFTVAATAGACALAWRAAPSRGARAFAIYAAGVLAVISGSAALHLALGGATPPWVLQWMPYRLVNHAPPLLLAAVLLGLARGGGAGTVLLAAALVWGALTPYLGDLFPARVHARYIAPGDAAAFLLLGAGWARLTVAAAAGPPARAVALAAPFVAALGFHRFGAACLVAGYGAAWAAGAFEARPARAHLPRDGFAAAVAAWAAANPRADRVVLTPPGWHGAQSRLGMAVLADATALSLISYVPEVGGAVAAIHLEAYGFDLRGDAGDWRAHWRGMDAAAWRAVAARHGFGLVAAPADLALPLRVEIATEEGTLYAVD